MGRPSVQDQRRQEVLDAFMTCVATYGVEGATLEKIAAEARLKRPLIRHHLGNREAMVLALGNHIAETLNQQSALLRESLRNAPSTRALIEVLFSTDHASDPRTNICYQSLSNSVALYPDLRQPLLSAMETLYEVAVDIVRAGHPTADAKICETVAHGIINLYVTTDAFVPLNPPESWASNSFLAAIRLAETLGAES